MAVLNELLQSVAGLVGDVKSELGNHNNRLKVLEGKFRALEAGKPPATAGPTPDSNSAAQAQVDTTPPDPTSSPWPGLTAPTVVVKSCGCVWPHLLLEAPGMTRTTLVMCTRHRPYVCVASLLITDPVSCQESQAESTSPSAASPT